MMKLMRRVPLALAAALVLSMASALFIASGGFMPSAEGAGQPPTASITVSTAAVGAPSDADLDAMVNACAKYMSQVPGAPSVTPGQMKDMMKGMMGSGGMMGR